jgi:hypothetical protein
MRKSCLVYPVSRYCKMISEETSIRDIGKILKIFNFVRLMFYSDVVQVSNPLAGSRHKMFCLYMTLGLPLVH